MSDKKKKRDKAIYSPFISAGVISVEELKKLVSVMEAEGAVNVKLGGEMIFVWDRPDAPPGIPDKAGYEANQFKFGGVRPVKMCSAETFCERFQKPVLDMAFKIDKLYHSADLEMKVMIGVAGCQRSCSEPSTKDIGVRAHPQGYEILVGGSAGMNPQVGASIGIVATAEDVLDVVGAILDYLKRYGKKTTRLGRIINKRGLEEFKQEVFSKTVKLS